MTYQFKTSASFDYVVRFPDDYIDENRYPVLIFLHGAGTRGTDINMVREHMFFKCIDENNSGIPMICVAPQCRYTTWFDTFEALKKFILSIASADFADPDRIYLMGASLGGYATWQMAISMPDIFAAIAPICGGGIACFTDRIVKIPVWAFHGALDTTVDVNESIAMVKALKAYGGKAKLTIYPENSHDAWTDTFNDPAVFSWLLGNSRSSGGGIENRFSGTEQFG